jgi:hypothetical protein
MGHESSHIKIIEQAMKQNDSFDAQVLNSKDFDTTSE